MLNVFANNHLGTVIVAAVVALILAALVFSLVRSKRKAASSGGCGCGCGCSGCPMSSKCHVGEEKDGARGEKRAAREE